MDVLSIFGKHRRRLKSARIAKERLQILITHARASHSNRPEYLPQLQRDLVKVIRQYVEIQEQNVNVRLDKGNACDILEVNIELPEN